MKITKFVHSCLLIERADMTVLIDPGSYSWESRLISVNHLPKLDYIVVTHEHPDHYHPPFLKALSAQFPYSPIVTNSDLSGRLVGEGLPNPIVTAGNEKLEVFEAAHEPLPLNQPVPKNIGVHVGGAITHPGDALHISQTKSVLALPITAPWGSLKQSLEQAVELKPRIILPIHDWHWHQAARTQMYAFGQRLLEPYGIRLMPLQNAQTVEL